MNKKAKSIIGGKIDNSDIRFRRVKTALLTGSAGISNISYYNAAILKNKDRIWVIFPNFEGTVLFPVSFP